MPASQLTDSTRISITDHEGRECSALLQPGQAGPIRIGRASENDIQIVSPYISRLHGEVWAAKEGVLYKDLSSTSGSYYEGVRVKKQNLSIGESIQLGSPSGLCLRVLREKLDEDTAGSRRSNTEVLKVLDAGTSQYASARHLSTQEDSSAKSKSRSKQSDLVEERLISLISLTNSLISITKIEELAETLLREVLSLLKVDRGMVLFENEGKLEPCVWRVPGAKQALNRSGRFAALPIDDVFDDGASEGDKPEAPFKPIKTVTQRVMQEGVGLLSLDAGKDQRFETSKSLVLQAVRAIMAVPIASSKKVYGVIYLDTQRPLNKSDEDSLDWLVAIGQQAGSIMDALTLAEEQRLLSESMMRGLAASIDARDGLTAGHSARVAHYSLGMARALDLDEDEQYRIYYAALLHDYGKIGVDDAVLRKPSSLTPEEYEHVKQHARFTFDILSKINFPRKLRDLPLMAASHHERWDGKGYPWELAGEAIPLAGRIIAIADVYDSLTRKRHYREPLPAAEVLAYLHEGSGTRFDPEVLDAFTRYHAESLAEKEERWQRRHGKSTAKNAEEPTLLSPESQQGLSKEHPEPGDQTLRAPIQELSDDGLDTMPQDN